MKIGKGLKKLHSESRELNASIAYLICSIVQNTLLFLTMSLFARILTTDENGVSTVYSSTMALVAIFTTLKLPYGSFATAMVKFENDRDGYISVVNIICVLLTLVYFIIYFLFRDFWNELLNLPTILMVLMGIEVLMINAQNLWMGKARFEYKYKQFVLVTFLSSIIATACSMAVVVICKKRYTTVDLGIARVFSNGVVLSIIGLVIFIISLRKGKAFFKKEYWKYALSFNLPLVPYYLSQMIFNQSDKLMINKMCGRGDASLYGIAYTIGFIMQIVLNAICDAYLPWVYRKLKNKEVDENRKISSLLACIMSVLIIGVIIIAPEIIWIFGGEKYASAVWVVPPVAMSLLLLFYSRLFINVEFFYEEKYKLVFSSILAAVVNIILNYYGIKRFGYVVAGYTTLVSYILFALCNYFSMVKLCREKGLTKELYNVKMLILLFIGIVIVGTAFTLLYPFRYIRFGIVLIAMIVLIIKRRIIIGFIKEFRSKMKK